MNSFLIFLLFLVSISNGEYNGNHQRRPPIHHGTSIQRGSPIHQPNVHIHVNRPIHHGRPIHIGPPIYRGPPIHRHGPCYHDTPWNICCNGILRPKHGLRPMCCGTESFDSSFYKCCAFGIIRLYC